MNRCTQMTAFIILLGAFFVSGCLSSLITTSSCSQWQKTEARKQLNDVPGPLL